jgi:hypothetical protein
VSTPSHDGSDRQSEALDSTTTDPLPGSAEPGTDVVLARHATAVVARSGPTAIADDSWDDLLTPGTRGPVVRHAVLKPRRIRVAVAAVLVGLGVVAAVPIVLNPRPTATLRAEPPAQPSDAAGPGFVSDPAVTTSPVEPMSTGRAASPGPSGRTIPRVAAAGATNPDGTNQSQAGVTTAPTTQALGSVTIEAETGVLTGSARVLNGYSGASGGKLVRGIGGWDEDDGSTGTLTLNGIVIPAAANYVITIHYVNLIPVLDIRALISVSAATSVWVEFDWESSCCDTATITMNIPAGTRSITVANTTGLGPWIDKVVISQA